MKYLNEDGLQVVADKINTRLKTVTEMPSTANDGAVRLYIGTDGTYLKGHIYKMVSNLYHMWRVSSRIVYTKGRTPSVGDIIYNWDGTVYTDSGDTVVEVNGTEFITSSNGMTYGNYGTQGEENWTDISAGGETADLNFDPTSRNAQSGIAVSQALKQIIGDNTDLDWESKTWTGVSNLRGQYIWTDSENNIYYSCYSTIQYVLNKSTGEWETKTWSDFNNISGDNVWKTDENIYYSLGPNQYIFNKSTGDWEEKVWYKSPMYGCDVWTDGTNIYYSEDSDNWVYNQSTDEWVEKTWYGLSNFRGLYIWTDGTNIYYSSNGSNYVLDKSTDTWKPKTWYGLTSFTGYDIWTDGIDVYYSEMNKQYKLNKSTNTWESVTWSVSSNFEGIYIWKDENEIYLSDGTNNYQLTRTTK